MIIVKMGFDKIHDLRKFMLDRGIAFDIRVLVQFKNTLNGYAFSLNSIWLKKWHFFILSVESSVISAFPYWLLIAGNAFVGKGI